MQFGEELFKSKASPSRQRTFERTLSNIAKEYCAKMENYLRLFWHSKRRHHYEDAFQEFFLGILEHSLLFSSLLNFLLFIKEQKEKTFSLLASLL
jgi:hypothetical protein